MTSTTTRMRKATRNRATTPTPPPPLPPTDREEEEGAAERGALGEAVAQGSRRHPKFAVKGEVGGVGGGEGEAAPDLFLLGGVWRLEAWVSEVGN